MTLARRVKNGTLVAAKAKQLSSLSVQKSREGASRPGPRLPGAITHTGSGPRGARRSTNAHTLLRGRLLASEPLPISAAPPPAATPVSLPSPIKTSCLQLGVAERTVHRLRLSFSNLRFAFHEPRRTTCSFPDRDSVVSYVSVLLRRQTWRPFWTAYCAHTSRCRRTRTPANHFEDWTGLRRSKSSTTPLQL